MQTVLVVDDSATTRLQLSVALNSAGYEVLEARDGLEALRILEQCDVAMVITDVIMPRLDGLELVKRVRAEGRYRSIPIVVLTIDNDAALMQRARQAGATDWFVKPFNYSAVAAHVRSTIGAP